MVGDGSLIIQTVIDKDPWNYGNLPEAYAKLSFQEDEGFLVEMWCYETGMRAVNQKPDSPVYEDSCLECFLNFYPEQSGQYLNFEVNANGVMLCQMGEGKRDRIFIRDKGLIQPEVAVEISEERGKPFWKVSYLIPLSLIEAVYGQSEFESGHKLSGNFYKCGDLTPGVHYGCWNQMEAPQPNFHLPEFFGELKLEIN